MSRPHLEVSPYPERRLKMFPFNFLNIGGGGFQENVDKRMQKTIVPIFAMGLLLSLKRHDLWTTLTGSSRSLGACSSLPVRKNPNSARMTPERTVENSSELYHGFASFWSLLKRSRIAAISAVASTALLLGPVTDAPSHGLRPDSPGQSLRPQWTSRRR